jgi:hypothetical protein
MPDLMGCVRTLFDLSDPPNAPDGSIAPLSDLVS